jgi:hypothetical protein
MAANATNEGLYRVDSDPPEEDEAYAGPTTVREMPPNVLALLKQKETDAHAIDSELADATDLANLIITRQSSPPVSGIVERAEPDADPEPVAIPTTEPAPVPSAQPSSRPRLNMQMMRAIKRPTGLPSLPSLEKLTSSVGFAVVVFSLAVVYAVVMRLLHFW